MSQIVKPAMRYLRLFHSDIERPKNIPPILQFLDNYNKILLEVTCLYAILIRKGYIILSLKLRRLCMKIQDIKSIAKKKSVTAGKMNQTDLIRAIQKAEGNNACFATSSVQICGQMNCMWRTDCK